MDNLINICPHCNSPVTTTDYFCPNCGKPIRRKPQNLSINRQIIVYLISFLLPPLGLWPAFRYLKDDNPKAHTIGYIAIVLTILSVIISIWSTYAIIGGINQAINSQLNSGSYSELGF